MIEVGSKAPSFNLHKSKTETVNSDDLRGKNVVLAFFPAAFTGVCEKEVCALRDGIASLNDANACLLYTSPSPRDQRGSRMPSSA